MENTSNILVFESSFHLSFSLPFLNYIISSISFISKVINITFSSLSIYTNVDIIQTKQSLNDVIIYQLQNRNHKSLPIYFPSISIKTHLTTNLMLPSQQNFIKRHIKSNRINLYVNQLLHTLLKKSKHLNKAKRNPFHYQFQPISKHYGTL